jgi:UDP-glucose 4-epimerase
MRVLVTGGAGFIGSHLSEALVARGHEVRVLDDLSTGTRENLAAMKAHIEWHEGDIRDPWILARVMRGVDVVYHQAALASVGRSVRDPVGVTEINAVGTMNVLAAAQAAGVRRVLFASSSSVYGDPDVPAKHEALPLTPLSPYAATKAAGEAFLHAFHQTHGMETLSLRYFNVYGPRQRAGGPYGAVIPTFLAACEAGRALRIEGDGLQTRDFTFIGDLCEALVLVLDAPCADGRALNLARGQAVSVLDLVQVLSEFSGRALTVEHVPARLGDVRHSFADMTRARALLGWSAETDLRAGLESLCATC